jgi:DNA-binding IclR family transcriptional regulator
MKLSSLEKSLQVIELLSRSPSGLSLLEMSNKLGIPKSTIHHILSTFGPHDYVSQDPDTRKYSLGLKFLTISKGILDSLDVRKIAYPHLRALHDKTGETVHLAVLKNNKVVYIDKIEKPGGLSLATYVGFTTEPHAAAGGKVMLAERPYEEIARIYRERPLQVFGKNTITSLSKLCEALAEIRRCGYAIDDEEYYEGVRCVAAPVRAGGEVIAAISVTGSVFTMTLERIQGQFAGWVKETAARISAEMCW